MIVNPLHELEYSHSHNIVVFHIYTPFSVFSSVSLLRVSSDDVFFYSEGFCVNICRVLRDPLDIK